MSALVLSATTIEESAATKVLSTTTKVESEPVVASLDPPPLQEIRAKEATKESKKIDFFISSFVLFYKIYIPVSSLCFSLLLKIFIKIDQVAVFYLQRVSAIEIAQGEIVLYLASIPIDSIRPTAALNREFDWYLGSGLRSTSI